MTNSAQNANGKIRIIDIPWTGSLYEPSSDSLLRRLEDLLNMDLKPGEVIVLRSDADLHDYSNSWLRFIREDAMWIDLYRRLTRWHLLFVRMIQSKSKFVFISGRDVVGSWWELGLACHARIFTNPYAKVGFPEVYIDMFPPIGVLGLKKYEAYDGPSNIRKHAILHAREGFKHGIIDLCLLSDLWIRDPGIVHLKAWLHSFSPKHEDRSLLRTDYKKGIPSELQIVEQRAEPATRNTWLAHVRVDAAFPLLRERSLGIRSMTLAQIRAAAGARFLHGDYRAWLSRRVTRYRLGLHDRWWVALTNLIMIDVTHGLPPGGVVKNLLLRRKRIIFTSPDHQKLRSALESIRGRFDRRDADGRDAFIAWDQSVCWVSAPKSADVRNLQCRFFSDDRVLFERGEAKVEFFRISGNYGNAGIGWYEQMTKDADVDVSDPNMLEIHETVALMANGVLTPVKGFVFGGVVMPLTVALRFLLLEFLVRFGSKIAQCKSLSSLLKLLGESGWGFAADQFQWENMLKNFRLHQELVEKFVGVWPDNEMQWQILNVPSVIHLTFDRGKDENSRDDFFDIRSGAAATRYIGVFAHSVVCWLVAQKLVESRDEGDLFVSLAWGYPGAIPLPSNLEQEVGVARMSRWRNQTTLGRIVTADVP